MTNAELIAKIKDEIERRKTVQLKRIQEGDLVDSAPYDKNEAYNEILSFLSTIESEKPMQEELEEAAKNYENSLDYHHYTGDNPSVAFIAGAKWQAEQLLKSSPLPEDTVLFNKGVEEGKRLMMEEAVNERWDELQTNFREINEAFEAGKKEQKEQMLKDGNVILAEEDFDAEKEKSMEWGYNLCKEQMLNGAVEGTIDYVYDEKGNAYKAIRLDWLVGDFGDKVHIIIVKEDKK